MKALIIDTCDGKVTGARLVADSAVGRDTMPLFIPDLLPRWDLDVCLAFRINRLGKNIPPRFAPRYIEAVGAVAVIRPTRDTAPPADSVAAAGLASFADSLVTTGMWLPWQPGMEVALDVSTTALDGTPAGLPLSCAPVVADDDITAALCAVTRLATVKSGDMLILPRFSVTLPLAADTYVDAAINGLRSLHLKVK